MTYFVLARKWRPQTFEEIIGQEHITTTLKNAISSGRLAHAYLFTGPRGVGKTSAARIFAKALNCEKGPTPSPCNNCASCKEITASIGLDVLEIDGASNTSVEQVRDLRENVKLKPSSGRFKIYIIDEVHMLSTSAFNALLKTLEEPPAHVKFIFATTQSHKVLPTIISRCQRFDFKRISIQKIISNLKEISTAEKVDIEEDALFHIARVSDGSMRDAQSILDQVISYKEGKITPVDISLLLGITGAESYFDFTDKIIHQDAGGILELINRIVLDGKDMIQFMSGLIEHFRNLIILKVSGNLDSLVSQTEENILRLKEDAKHFTQQDLLYGFSILVAAQENMRRSSDMRIPLEIAAVKLTQISQLKSLPQILKELKNLSCANFGDNSVAAPQTVMEKITSPKNDAVEKTNPVRELRSLTVCADGGFIPPLASSGDDHRLKSVAFSNGVKSALQNSSAERQNKTEIRVEVSAPGNPASLGMAAAPPPQIAAPKDVADCGEKNSEEENLKERWKAFVETVKSESLLAGLYLGEGGILKMENNQVFIGFHIEKNFHLDYLDKKENKQLIEKKLSGFLGRQIKVCLVKLEEEKMESKSILTENTAAPKTANEKPKELNPIIEAALNIFDAKIVE